MCGRALRVDYAYTAEERVYLSISVTVNGSTQTIVSSQVPIVQIYTLSPVCFKAKRTVAFIGICVSLKSEVAGGVRIAWQCRRSAPYGVWSDGPPINLIACQSAGFMLSPFQSTVCGQNSLNPLSPKSRFQGKAGAEDYLIVFVVQKRQLL